MLEEYKDIIAGVAGILTTLQMFSGMFILRDIYRVGSTKNFPSTPFVGGIVISILFAEHGRLLADKALGLVNFVGIIINVFYVIFFTAFSGPEERAALKKSFAVAAAVLAVLLSYTRVENEQVVAVRFGVVVTLFLLVLMSAPLFSIKEIMETKNTDKIPFPMVASGTVVGLSWALYGIAANQSFIVYQNLLFLAIGIPQLILCLMYPSKKVKSS